LCYSIQDKTIQMSLGDFPPVQRLKILVKIDEKIVVGTSLDRVTSETITSVFVARII